MIYWAPDGVAIWEPGQEQPQLSDCQGQFEHAHRGRVLDSIGKWSYNPQRLRAGLYWCDLENGEIERLSSRPDGIVSPSPEGERLAIIRADEILVTDLHGSHIVRIDVQNVLGLRPLVEDGIAGQPISPEPKFAEWSPGGEFVAIGYEDFGSRDAVVRGDGDSRAWVVDVDTGEVRLLSPERVWRAAWITVARIPWLPWPVAKAAPKAAIAGILLLAVTLLGVVGTRVRRLMGASA